MIRAVTLPRGWPGGEVSWHAAATISRPPEVIIADRTPLMAAGNPISRDSSRLLPGAEVSSWRTPVMAAASEDREVVCHQGKTSVRSPVPHEGVPAQYPWLLRPVQVRVFPVARSMTWTTPYVWVPTTIPSCSKDRASLVPSGDRAMPASGMAFVETFSLAGGPGRPV